MPHPAMYPQDFASKKELAAKEAAKRNGSTSSISSIHSVKDALKWAGAKIKEIDHHHQANWQAVYHETPKECPYCKARKESRQEYW
jgi:hypothetical protein